MPDKQTVPASEIWRQINRIFSVRPKVLAYAHKTLTGEKAPEKWELGQIEGGAKIFLVNGDRVKKAHHMDFVEGGNGAVYDFVPRNELWIDVLRDASTWTHIAYHEAVEWWLMTYDGFSYEEAHKRANELERRKIESIGTIVQTVNCMARMELVGKLIADVLCHESGVVIAPFARTRPWRAGVGANTPAAPRPRTEALRAAYGLSLEDAE